MPSAAQRRICDVEYKGCRRASYRAEAHPGRNRQAREGRFRYLLEPRPRHAQTTLDAFDLDVLRASSGQDSRLEIPVHEKPAGACAATEPAFQVGVVGRKPKYFAASDSVAIGRRVERRGVGAAVVSGFTRTGTSTCCRTVRPKSARATSDARLQKRPSSAPSKHQSSVSCGAD